MRKPVKERSFSVKNNIVNSIKNTNPNNFILCYIAPTKQHTYEKLL